MLKLIRYLKPYTVFIVVAVALLFVQAMTELALPDYMSNIVNVGIQQGGIEDAIPEVVSKETFDDVSLFMSQEERQQVLSYYDLISKESANYEENLKKYPILESKDVYVLKSGEIEDRPSLNLILGKALMAYSGVKNGMVGENGSFAPPSGFTIPEGANVLLLLRLMPEAQRLEMLNQVDSMVEVMGKTIVNQSGALAVKEIYEELGMNTQKLQSGYVLRTGFIMVLMTLLSVLCTIMVAFIASKIAAASARTVRRDVFEKVENFSNSEFAQFSTASLITRTTNDITQIQLVVVLIIRMVFYAPIIGVGGIIRALEKSASMSWIIALAVIILLGMVGIVFAIALPKFKKMQKLVDKLNLVTREHLSGLMVVRAFNTQKFEEERFDAANRDFTRTDLFVNRVMVVLMPAIMFVMNGTMLLIVWVGAHQIEASTMQVGDMMAYIQYSMLIIFAFLMLTMMFIMIPRASVSGARVSEILEVDPQIKDPKNPKKFSQDFKGTVEFKNVCYRFPGAEKNILNSISFTAIPGQTTAIIGSTGSGKSTLLNMIPRFYDVCGGQVLVDGIDIREVSQHDLRERIGYVPQKGVLFSGTIESNLKYADETAPKEEVERAAEIARAVEFITAKEEGYDSPISQGGTNVSGGQKQRLSIARALLKRPQIFLFDDSFSALDFKTDAALRRKLKEETGDSTMIIVGQRIATIKNADQILVLDEGNLVGIGKHHQLMKSCQIYREIALSQLSEAELA
ncbi:MAG TPA: ABC transporter ATP-binding protein [Mesotoga sp.]|nr:ABC transporter ATP-binding protein [Mesotoga sp.]MDI9376223.1 ABC transporter ATP-binding protein [Thermotogota bacterium]NLX33273.1 ABC transporter ATP-binding protein [Thermotogaceae bacterium]MDD4041438.1 ABC transporter ATP-binding protein [Mesotoga sp.]MDD5744269.1 ABC transporter ATP-binding protein [Mesotoga sp.]